MSGTYGDQITQGPVSEPTVEGRHSRPRRQPLRSREIPERQKRSIVSGGAREYRYDGDARRRYLVRDRDPADVSPISNTWREFLGSLVYADLTIDEQTGASVAARPADRPPRSPPPPRRSTNRCTSRTRSAPRPHRSSPSRSPAHRQRASRSDHRPQSAAENCCAQAASRTAAAPRSA